MRVANELPYPVLSGPVNKSKTSRNDLFLIKTKQEQSEDMKDIALWPATLGYVRVSYGLEQIECVGAIQLQGEQREQQFNPSVVRLILKVSVLAVEGDDGLEVGYHRDLVLLIVAHAIDVPLAILAQLALEGQVVDFVEERHLIRFVAHIQAHLPHVRTQCLRQSLALAYAVDVVDSAVVQQCRLQLNDPAYKRGMSITISCLVLILLMLRVKGTSTCLNNQLLIRRSTHTPRCSASRWPSTKLLTQSAKQMVVCSRNPKAMDAKENEVLELNL